MPAIYRVKKVENLKSPYFGKVERWEPVIDEAGRYELADRFAEKRHHAANKKFAASVEEAIALLATGRFCIWMRGLQSRTRALLKPESVIVEQ